MIRNREAIARLQVQIDREKAEKAQTEKAQTPTGAPTDADQIRRRQAPTDEGGTDMELTKAQTTWHAEFRERVADVESAYHYWQNAEDRRRANTKAEEDRDLSHRATVKQNKHSDALRWLTEWVQARPYPATDQTAPTPAPTVTDSLREANRLAQLCDDKQQYRNGWNGAMEAVEDVLSTSEDARAWADRMLSQWWQKKLDKHPADEYARGMVGALNHFLQTRQTDRHAP
jgi:hypothetical protein